MKRTKRIYVLLCVLLVACGVTFGVSSYEKQKEAIKNSDEIILQIDRETVQALSWENETDKLAFHKEETWLYDEDEAFPVDEEKIGELLEVFQEFGVSFVIEDVEDFGQYGLDDPVGTIQIKTEAETYEILLGDFSKMDSQRYVSIGDGKVYLVKNDPLDYFDAVLKDMIAHDELPVFEQVSQVQFAGTEHYQITYEEDSSHSYCDSDVYFTEQDAAVLPLDTTLVDGYLQTMSQLELTDYVTYQASEEDVKACGLDEPELSVTVQYTTTDEEEKETEGTVTLHIGRDPKEQEKEEEITAYARVGESKIIYQIPGNQYEELMKASCDDLRHQEIFTADSDDISQIDISLEGKDYTITAEGKDDKKTYYYQEEELETTALSDALYALRADRFTEEAPTQKEEISLKIHLENENFPEVAIQLYRYDGQNCLAAVDGEPVALVARSQVVDLIEAVNEIVLEQA